MEVGNGHSHCMSMLLGPAGESIPVQEGELCLGTWQRVLFLELDRERDRRWLVQVVGDGVGRTQGPAGPLLRRHDSSAGEIPSGGEAALQRSMRVTERRRSAGAVVRYSGVT